MTRQPVIVPAGSMLCDAVNMMAERKLSELPVVNADGVPVGLLDITDLVNVQAAPKSDDSDTISGPRMLPQSREPDSENSNTTNRAAE